jgi:hypothetical protein
MFSYYSYFDRAQRLAHQSTAAIANFNAQDAMYHITCAVAEIEQAVGTVKNKFQITLDPNSATGAYSLPSDYLAMDTLTWAPDATTIAFYDVDIWTPDAWKEFVTNQIQLGPVTPLLMPNAGGIIVAMIEYGKLVLAPLGITGVLTMRYKPVFTPYSADDPLWASFSPNPETNWRTAGPDISIADAQRGIVDYLVAQMLRQQRDGLERFRGEILMREESFRKSIWPVARESTDPVMKTPQKLYPMGGMR